MRQKTYPLTTVFLMKSIDMHPTLTLNDAFDSRRMNTELNPELLLSDAAARVANPYLPDLRGGQRRGRALLHRHVQIVRRARSEKKMTGAHAGRVVAMVNLPRLERRRLLLHD